MAIVTELALGEPQPATLLVEIPPGKVNGEHLVFIPGEVTLRLPTAEVTGLSLFAEEFWAADEVVLPGKSKTDARIEVFAASPVGGTVNVESGELPQQVELRLEEVPPWLRKDQLPAPSGARFDCPVEPSGKWLCSVPAGTFDLRLGALGKVPHYVWNRRIVAGEPFDLGPVALRTGASVSGRVESEDRQPLEAMVKLRPVQVQFHSKEPPLDPGLRQRVLTAPINERGFFQLTGVAAGGYEIYAEQQGYAEMLPVTIDVVEEREAILLSPLVLRRPVTVEIVAEPATDPWHKTWRAQFEAREGWLRRKGELSESGRWQVKDLPAGSYKLRIENYRGDQMHALDVEIGPDTGEIRVSLPLVRVHGLVKLGKEPVAGQLWMSHGKRRIHFFVDSEKGFDAYLPEIDPPLWEPEILLEGQSEGSLKLKAVEVLQAPGLDHAHLDLELPDSELRGQVVNAEGQPVKKASVIAILESSLGALQTTYTDSDGKFLLRGVALEKLSIHAEKDGASSELVELDLSQSKRPPELLLALGRLRTITGLVLAPGGQPQPGVKLSLVPIASPGSAPRVFWGTNRTTDLSGVFESQVPEDTQEIRLAVFAPGFAARLLRVSLNSNHPLLVQLDHSMGELELLFAGGQPGILQQAKGLLRHDGAEAPMVQAGEWARFLNTWTLDRIVLPMMEPGLYEICEPQPKDGSARRCADGFLAPGGQLSLSLR